MTPALADAAFWRFFYPLPFVDDRFALSQKGGQIHMGTGEEALGLGLKPLVAYLVQSQDEQIDAKNLAPNRAKSDASPSAKKGGYMAFPIPIPPFCFQTRIWNDLGSRLHLLHQLHLVGSQKESVEKKKKKAKKPRNAADEANAASRGPGGNASEAAAKASIKPQASQVWRAPGWALNVNVLLCVSALVCC